LGRDNDQAPVTWQQSSNYPATLTETFRSMHRAVSEVVDASICFFGAYDPRRETVTVLWQVEHHEELPGGAFPLGSGLTSQVIRERQPRLVRHRSHEGPHVNVQYATDRPDLPESGITVPMLFEERVLGVFAVQSYRAAAYNEGHLELVQAVVERAAPTVAALLKSEHTSPTGTNAAPNVDQFAQVTEDAALALDRAGRLVRMNQAARSLLALDHHSVVFGFPIGLPQAGNWPLGSSKLAEALRPMLDRFQRGEPLSEGQTVFVDNGERLIQCTGSAVMDGGVLSGVLVTLRPSDGT
jgi:hypothetical protein